MVFTLINKILSFSTSPKNVDSSLDPSLVPSPKTEKKTEKKTVFDDNMKQFKIIITGDGGVGKTSYVSAIILYTFTPNFALTVDDDQKPKKHLGIIVSTSLLLGFSAALIYLLQFIRNSKPSAEVDFQKLDRRTIVGNSI